MTNLRNHGRADKSVTGMSNLRNHGGTDNSGCADFLDNWIDDLSSWCGCVKWDSWRTGLSIVGHNSVESVYSVSSVSHPTNSTVRVSNSIRAGHHVTIPSFFPGFGITGFGIGYRISEPV